MYNYLEARYILFLFHLFLFVFADFIINRKHLLHFKIKNINEEFFLPQYEPNIVKISDLYCQNWTVQCCDYISKMNDFFVPLCSILWLIFFLDKLLRWIGYCKRFIFKVSLMVLGSSKISRGVNILTEGNNVLCDPSPGHK